MNEAPAESPYDTQAEHLASQFLHGLRKPEELRDEEDRDRLIDLGERLAREVLDDD